MDGTQRKPPRQKNTPEFSDQPAEGMERYRLEVGMAHGVKAGNIVGAIANEAGLEGQYITQLKIHDEYSTVDLPVGMPKDIFRTLKKTWVSGRRLNISRLGEPAGTPETGKQPLRKKQNASK